MLRLLAPAKINVTLEVLSRRSDGYHTLRSVFLPIALYDRLDFEPSLAGSFTTAEPALASDNLAERALKAAGLERAFNLTLHKRIPVGAGLGGGSSDAAAVLRAAMDGTLGPRPECDWLEIARNLGSDVPFFLSGTGALVEGVGERVTPLGALPPWWALVARPHAFVATADAYRRLDDAFALHPPPPRPRSTSLTLAAVDAIQRHDFAGLQRLLSNDFHAPILEAYPEVARCQAALRAAGAPRALLSGSGSCLFALFEEEAEAGAVAERVEPSAAQALFTVPLHHEAAWR